VNGQPAVPTKAHGILANLIISTTDHFRLGHHVGAVAVPCDSAFRIHCRFPLREALIVSFSEDKGIASLDRYSDIGI
jgi:hypothetical protein